MFRTHDISIVWFYPVRKRMSRLEATHQPPLIDDNFRKRGSGPAFAIGGLWIHQRWRNSAPTSRGGAG
jgi:hypothetical protein